jgi:hypothetical protein
MIGLLGALAIAIVQMPTGADIECVISGMSEEAASTLTLELLEGGTGPSNAALKPLEQSVETCSTRNAWTQAHAASVGGLAVASLMGGAAEELLKEAGVPGDAIRKWLAAEPEAVQTRLEMAQSDAERLADALQAGGIAKEKVAAAGSAIGIYLGSLIVFERARRGLPME